MHFLVLQHIDCEHPGIFRRFMRQLAINWTAVRLNAGDALPAPDGYDALLVMGGPMDVWQTDEHPWLIAEKAYIRNWVSQQRPYLGLCLGHQLLADAMGGRCAPARHPEIGILDLALNAYGIRDQLFAAVDPTMRALQWHSVEVTEPPNNATVLAYSSQCAIQAMRIHNAWGMQYHTEIEDDTIDNWGKVPAYAAALEQVLGKHALTTFKQQALPYMATFARNAQTTFTNFARYAARHRQP